MKRRYYNSIEKSNQSSVSTLAKMGIFFGILFVLRYLAIIILILIGLLFIKGIALSIRVIKKRKQEQIINYSTRKSGSVKSYTRQIVTNTVDTKKGQKIQEFRTKKGEIVKSYGEQVIANYLYGRGIKYEYEKPYQRMDGGINKPDFYLQDHDMYIEYFGMINYSKKYRFNMHLKFETFKKENMKVIKIYPNHIIHNTLEKGLYMEFKRLTENNLPCLNRA